MGDKSCYRYYRDSKFEVGSLQILSVLQRGHDKMGTLS